MNLKKIENKFAVSLFGLIIAILYIIYTEFIKSDSPEMTFSALINNKVLQINEKIDSLKVILNGVNLTDSNQHLFQVTINIKNTGAKDITENMYSNESLFGLKFNKIRLIGEPQILNKGENNFNPHVEFLDSVNILKLPKLMFDKNQNYIVKFLCVSNYDSISISAIGKISGVKSPIINIRNQVPFEALSEANSSRKISIFLQLILGLLFWIVISVILELIQKLISFSNGKKRKSFITKFESSTKTELPQIINEVYMANGKSDAIKLIDLLTDNEALIHVKDASTNVMKNLNVLRNYDSELNKEYDLKYCKGKYKYSIDKLLNNDLHKYCDISLGNVVGPLKKEVIDAANEFKNYLKFE